MQLHRDKTVTITVPSGTVAGLYEYDVPTDSNQDVIEGIAGYEINAANATYYRIALKVKQGAKFLQELVHKNNWLSTNATPIEQHYKKVDTEAKGTTYVCQVEIGVTLNADLVFDLVLRQSNSCNQ